MITYRTDDLSKWGFGKGSDLDAVEIDLNFWDLDLRVATLEASALGKQIDFFFDVNGSLYVQYTDHTVDGPFPIPVFVPNWRGLWTPDTLYFFNDVIYYGAKIYLVVFDHTSASTFDPGANDGNAHNFYQIFINVPPIPTKEVTAATYTPTIADANYYIRFTNPTGCVITIDSVAIAGWTVDSEMQFRDASLESPSGGLSVIAASPATLYYDSAQFLAESSHLGSTLFLKMWDTDQWDLGGGLKLQ